MTKPANRKRGEIALPEAGEGAFLRFPVDSLERLETEYGDDWLDAVLGGMTKGRVSVYRALIGCSVNDASTPPEDVGPWPWGLGLEGFQRRVLDALFVAVYNRDYAQQQEHERKEFERQVEEAEKNPQMAARLLRILSETQDIGLASSQKTSAASPPTKSSNTPE